MNHFGFLNTRYQPTEQEKKSRELKIKREKKIIRETNLKIGDKNGTDLFSLL